MYVDTTLALYICATVVVVAVCGLFLWVFYALLKIANKEHPCPHPDSVNGVCRRNIPCGSRAECASHMMQLAIDADKTGDLDDKPAFLRQIYPPYDGGASCLDN